MAGCYPDGPRDVGCLRPLGLRRGAHRGASGRWVAVVLHSEGADMKLSTQPTATQTVELKPVTKAKLTLALRRYLAAYEQLAALEATVELEKRKIIEQMGREGISKLDLEGFKVAEVTSTYKHFDEQKYVALGGSWEPLRGSTEERPKRPYWKVSVPKPTAEEGR